jgi:methionyl-tRNA formyltransferase
MKIAFFGTWDFSANILKSLLIDYKKDIDVKLVVSQPDKPVWRKKILEKTPIKIVAEENNIEVLQPYKLKDNTEFFDKLNSLNLDFIVVVAYGKIVPLEVLNAPKKWCINIHGSILPAYRWASPIQESIKNWDKKTGLTIMYMAEWMDTWDILEIKEIEISDKDKTIDLFEKFEKFWPDLLVNTLNWILSWNILGEEQDDSKATYCSKILKIDWEVNFEKETGYEIYNKFRAYYPWPWIYSYYNNKKFSIENCYLEDIDLWDDLDFKVWDIVELENENWEKNTQIW